MSFNLVRVDLFLHVLRTDRNYKKKIVNKRRRTFLRDRTRAG